MSSDRRQEAVVVERLCDGRGDVEFLSARRKITDARNEDDGDVAHPERGMPARHDVVEVREARAEPDGPVRVVALAGGEGGVLPLVDAVADPVQAPPAQRVVGRGEGIGVVDDAGAGLEIVVHTVADQPVLAVVEDDLALRDRLPRIAVELHPFGEKPGGPAHDLDIADRDEQLGGAGHLLDLIRGHAHLAGPLLLDRDGRPPRLRKAGTGRTQDQRQDEEQGAPDRTRACGRH